MSKSSSTAPKQIGEYIMLKPKIGEGTFAQVFRGYRISDKKPVAIKVIKKSKVEGNDKLRSQLDFEISLLKRKDIDHSFIIELFCVHKSKSSFYIIMEFCGGGDLSYVLKQQFPHGMPEPLVKKFLYHMTAGLASLRKCNILHRDLKPQNLLLTDSDINKAVIKIADFGLAREIEPEKLAATMCGSPLYLAPEVLNSQPYNEKADLWAVGCILFEMFTGRPPYMALTLPDLIKTINANAVYIPSNIPMDAKNLLLFLLQRDPTKRLDFKQFMSFKYVIDAISTYVPKPKPTPPPAVPVTPSTPSTVNNQTPNLPPPPKKTTPSTNATTEQQKPATNLTDLPPPSTSVPTTTTPPTKTPVLSVPSTTSTTTSSPSSSADYQIPSLNSTPEQPSISPQVSTASKDVIVESPQEPILQPAPELSKEASTTTSKITEESFIMIQDSEVANVGSNSLVALLEFNQSLSAMVSSTGRVSYSNSVLEFSSPKLDVVVQKPTQTDSQLERMIKHIEEGAKRAWVIGEAGFLKEHFAAPAQALVLYIAALQQLLSAFRFAKAAFQAPYPQRITEILSWIRFKYDGFTDRAMKLHEKLKLTKSEHEQLSAASVLYKYALSLAREAAYNEYMSPPSECEAMYTRAKLAFEYLLYNCDPITQQSDRDALTKYVNSVSKRMDMLRERTKK